MKYMTLALIMVAPCLAQASQYVTGILSTSSSGHHSIQEVATDLPLCQSLEDIQSNSSECLTGRTMDVIVPESDHDDQSGAHDSLETELQSLSGSLVRLTGKITSFAGGRAVFFVLSLQDTIQIISTPAPQPEPQPLPCGNYNGVCH